jgi:hypothetical protein
MRPGSTTIELIPVWAVALGIKRTRRTKVRKRMPKLEVHIDLRGSNFDKLKGWLSEI